MNPSISVGITGGIGSGKSTICKIFAALGVPIYYADDRAKTLMYESEWVKNQIILLFGKASYHENGLLNNVFLGKQVFNDPKKLKELNAIVHPAVALDYKHWKLKHQKKPYTIKEAALIFESGAYKELDYVINVFAPEEMRIKRVLQRDAFRDIQQVQGILSKQLTDGEREQRSDFTILNDNTLLTIPQVLSLNELFLSKN